MTERTHRQRVAHGLLMGLLVAGGLAAAQPAAPGEMPPPPSTQTQTTSGASAGPPPAKTPDAAPGSAPGMRIYIDPRTGVILKEPAPGTVPLQLTPELQNAFSTSHHGLGETPGSVPGGGVKVDLQGRFQSPLFVTIDADGKVKLRHLDEAPETGDKKE